MDRYKPEIKEIAGNKFLVAVDVNSKFVAINVSEISEIEDNMSGEISRLWVIGGGCVSFPFSISVIFDSSSGDYDPFEEYKMTASEVCVASGGISMAVVNCLMHRLGFPRYKEVNGKKLWLESEVKEWVRKANGDK